MAEEFGRPIVTVDIVLLTVADGELAVALFEREAEPAIGKPALVGGFVHTDEDQDAEDAAQRILRRKTGLTEVYIEQLQTFSGRERDPRGWSISVAYFALVPKVVLDECGTKSPILKPVNDPGDLPFDHRAILDAACQRLRNKGAYSTMPACLLPEEFTMSELMGIYEIVLGEKLDQSAFRRKITDLDLLETVEGKRKSKEVRRPTTVYRLKSSVGVFDRRISQMSN